MAALNINIQKPTESPDSSRRSSAADQQSVKRDYRSSRCLNKTQRRVSVYEEVICFFKVSVNMPLKVIFHYPTGCTLTSDITVRKLITINAVLYLNKSRGSWLKIDIYNIAQG